MFHKHVHHKKYILKILNCACYLVSLMKEKLSQRTN
uniref:Uncharacterized protein n=1 Tax=Rhizophora mucronata TaxID=61149 RepID=A0A2P2NDU7_RHIMU